MSATGAVVACGIADGTFNIVMTIAWTVVVCMIAKVVSIDLIVVAVAVNADTVDSVSSFDSVTPCQGAPPKFPWFLLLFFTRGVVFNQWRSIFVSDI